jgi:hypothetical protein
MDRIEEPVVGQPFESRRELLATRFGVGVSEQGLLLHIIRDAGDGKQEATIQLAISYHTFAELVALYLSKAGDWEVSRLLDAVRTSLDMHPSYAH